MLNLLYGELYKLKKSRLFWICCVLCVAFEFFFFGCILPMQQDGSFLTAASEMICTIYTLTTLAFCTLFSLEDYKNGAIKNLAGKGFSRNVIFMARYAACLLGTVILMLLTVAALLAGGLLFIGAEMLTAQVLKQLFVFAGVQLLLNCGTAGVYVLFSEWSRNQGIALAAAVGLSLFGPLLAAGVDGVLERFGFGAAQYMVFVLAQGFPMEGYDRAFLLQTILVGIAWIVGTGLIGALHFIKTDIK